MASVSVRYVKDRGWIVDLSEKVTGKRNRLIKTFGFGAKAKKAAEQHADKQRREVDTGKFWQRRNATFEDLWGKFEAHELIEGMIAPATIADYKASARLYLLPYFGHRELNEIDVECVMTFKAKLLSEPGVKAAGKEGSKKPLTGRTVAKILTLLGTVFRYGDIIGLVSSNPVAKVRKPRAAKRPIYMMTPEEIALLRDAFAHPRDRVMGELEFTTGLRSGEIRGLSWKSVDLKAMQITVKTQATRRRADDKTKTESSVRTVPIASYLIPQLESWRRDCPATPQGLVFPGEPDENGVRKPLAADHLLRNILRPALKKAGLPSLRWQDLRHLACSLMASTGRDLAEAQQMMGHASILTTLKIYTHVWNSRRRDSADKMAELAGLTPAGNNRETKPDAQP